MHCGFYCTCHSIFPNLCHPTLIRKNCSQQRVLAIHVYLKKSHTIFGIMKKLMLIVCTLAVLSSYGTKRNQALAAYSWSRKWDSSSEFPHGNGHARGHVIFQLRWFQVCRDFVSAMVLNADRDFLHWHCGLILYSCTLVFMNLAIAIIS